MSYNLEIPTTTSGTEEDPFNYIKNNIEKNIKNACKKISWDQQEYAISFLKKLYNTTSSDNIISLDENEKKIMSIIANKFLEERGVDFLFRVPELYYIIKDLRHTMDLNDIKIKIEVLTKTEKENLQTWLDEHISNL